MIKLQLPPFLLFALRFILAFLFMYEGMHFITGITVPGGYYSPFLDKYFNLVAALRFSLIFGTKTILGWMGIETYRVSERILRVIGGRGVIVSYSCLGIGVLSFWWAFMLAIPQTWKNRFLWLMVGSILLWLINVCRIGLFLLAINKGWPMPFGIDHHTWFNIASYILIFILIYFFDHFQKKMSKKS